MTTSEIMPSLTQSYADKFAANWKAQNPTEDDEDNGSLDDSLTSLQWLHHINIQDITASNSTSTLSDASGSAEGSNFSDSECQSDSEESKDSDLLLKEPSVDYKNDAYHKPPYSYATLICMAMRETKRVKITLSSIYKWIKDNFMYYRMADPTWQVSTHNNSITQRIIFKLLTNRYV
jgi:forkhead box protein J1